MDNIISSNQPQKQCTKCKVFKPATTEYFWFSKKNRSGFNSQCRDCCMIAYRIAHPNPRRKVWPLNSVPEGQRRCTKCEEIKPATYEYFNLSNTIKCGLDYYCKTCTSKASKLHHQAHREQMREYNKEYGKNHLEERRRRRRKHEETHGEQIKQYRREYAKTHIEQRRTHQRNRHARARAAKGVHTAEQIKQQYDRQKGKCYYCRDKVKLGEYHVDHTFPLSRVMDMDIPVNSIDYLVITCQHCNESKNNKFPWEWPEGGRLL